MTATGWRSKLPLPLLVCLLTLFGGCRRAPELTDTLGTAIDNEYAGSRTDSRDSATIVVLASVQHNQTVAKRVRTLHYPNVYLDLHSVRCRIENALKGGLTEPEFRFFYFGDGNYPDSKPYPASKSRFQAKPGSRYLFFLTRENGLLRSIGDVGDYSTLVLSGSHSDIPTKDVELGLLITELLLTPGPGADLPGMAARLSEYSWTADLWGSRPVTVRLLRSLLSGTEPLRSAACGVLQSRYRGQYDCLQTLAGDANISSELRQRLLAEEKVQNVQRQLVLEDLRDPARLAYEDWAGDSRRRLREELETLLFAPDALLHERTCVALKRYYPWDAEPMCLGKINNSGYQ